MSTAWVVITKRGKILGIGLSKQTARFDARFDTGYSYPSEKQLNNAKFFTVKVKLTHIPDGRNL